MVREINDLNQLLDVSIEITEATEIQFPQYSSSTKANLSWINSDYFKKYSYKEGIYAFVDFTGKYHLIPYFKGVEYVLRRAGYEKTDFEVYLTRGESLVEGQGRWEDLINDANETSQREYEYELEEIAQEKGLWVIPEEMLKGKCKKLPGVGLFSTASKNAGKPKIYSEIISPETIMALGTYNFNGNGVLIFIYRDGNAYITRNVEISQILARGMYRRDTNLFVPNFNGESFSDKKKEKIIIKAED